MPTLEDITDAEEVDDLDLDLAEFDPDLVTPVAPRQRDEVDTRAKQAAQKEAENNAKGVETEIPTPSGPLVDPSIGSFNAPGSDTNPELPKVLTHLSEEEKKQLTTMQLLYPCYFDENRSVKEGRRAPIEKCIENPLGKTVLDACKELGLPSMLETDKSHPQDFGNPGRVRVALKYKGEHTTPEIKSKRQLIYMVGDYMVKHPTTLASVKMVPGPPELMQSNYKPMEVPKVAGFKMNTIVPLHSPYTMKNPETAGAYSKMHAPQEVQPKKMKPKFKRIRV